MDWKACSNLNFTSQKQAIFSTLSPTSPTFFNQKPKYESIDVYLLISAVGSGGGANIGPGRVTVECTALSTDKVQSILNTLYHEATHLVFEYGYYQNLLEQLLTSVKDKFSERHAFFKSGINILRETCSKKLKEYLARILKKLVGVGNLTLEPTDSFLRQNFFLWLRIT